MRQPTLPGIGAPPRRLALLRSGTDASLLCAIALALLIGGMHARAWSAVLPEVQSQQPPQHIHPAELNAAALQAPSANDPAQERALQQLRAAAASTSAPRRAAGQPSPRDAAWLLGLLALHGRAMPEDTAQARRWFERAQLLGHPQAAAGLAWCLMDGCAGPPNPIEARAWIARLHSTDPGRALYLQWRVESQLAPLQIAAAGAYNPNNTPTRQLLLRAAQAGNAQALNELGLENVSADRLPKALAQFRAAAARSPAAAANARLLANRLQLATRPPQSHPSADQRFAQALRYHRGDGVPTNYTEALRLYQAAAASGSKPAQQMLARIYARPRADGTVDTGWMQQLANLDVTREGALLSTLPAPSPQIFVRDPTPLYDLIPPPWR